MSIYEGSNALVTGAGSGIGLALSEALIARGANVWLSDVNEETVCAAANTLGPKAHAEVLDVRDGPAVAKWIKTVADEHGGIDFVFNNAGVGAGGESHEVTVEQYDWCIDINIRGVTNGVAAAYPIMVKQGRGHIVNTASAAGLLPAPLMVPYVMTKHAVVGLSKALRLEAEAHGVKVNVLCPTAIETPLLDTQGNPDTPMTWRPNIRRYLERLGGPPMPVEDFANYSLDEIERNTGVIVAPASGRAATLLYKLAPWLVDTQIRRALANELADKPADG